MKKSCFNNKNIIKKKNINLKGYEYVFDNIFKFYDTKNNLVILDFLKNSKLLKEYLEKISKDKNILSNITISAIDIIKKDLEIIISYEKQIFELRNKFENKNNDTIVTNINYNTDVNVVFDIKYIIYLKKYGAPENGIFDEDLLKNIEKEYFNK